MPGSDLRMRAAFMPAPDRIEVGEFPVPAPEEGQLPQGARVLTVPPGRSGGCFAVACDLNADRLHEAERPGATRTAHEDGPTALAAARAQGHGAAKESVTLPAGAA